MHFLLKMWAFALPLWAYVLVGFCPRGFCPRGFCPRGFCPRGFCPDTKWTHPAVTPARHCIWAIVTAHFGDDALYKFTFYLLLLAYFTILLPLEGWKAEMA